MYILIKSKRPNEVLNQLPFASLAREGVVIRSPLEDKTELNDHLVWFWGILKHKRRVLKRLQSDGCEMTCHYTASSKSILIRPNGAELLHLLNLSLDIEVAGQ